VAVRRNLGGRKIMAISRGRRKTYVVENDDKSEEMMR
jgi:hypothetical protein